nr:efflux RND transporter periplasmic adaptor subunit [Amylibacter sp.]
MRYVPEIGRLTCALLAATAFYSSALPVHAQGMPGQGPVEVGIVTAQITTVPYSVTLPGRAVAFESANIRPTIEGIVEQVNYRPGVKLAAGDLMYTLQKDRYAAAAGAALAEKTGAEEAVAAAARTVERYSALVGAGVTQAQLEAAQTELLQARATLSSAQSAVTVANLDLAGTEIRSPIEGIPSVSEISVGAIVTANQTTALATVTRMDPIYVDMTESSARMLRTRNRIDSGDLVRGDKMDVALTLEDGSVYGGKGTFVSPGTTVSTTTGALELRLQFDNPERKILPGQFLRVTVTVGTSQAILVPQRGTKRGSDGKLSALIVRDGKAARVVLTESGSYQNNWIVTDGVSVGDQVIVDGLKTLQAGAEVLPVPVSIDENGLVVDVKAAPETGAESPATDTNAAIKQ